jgi:hypothetical protein
MREFDWSTDRRILAYARLMFLVDFLMEMAKASARRQYEIAAK